MSVIIFIIILAVLVLVHEIGHFLTAKNLGIRVDEFGIGFPPKLMSRKVGETRYSLNLIPFGGFVRIFGEQVTEDMKDSPDWSRSFPAKPRWAQAIVLSGGVAFNMLFAWLLFAVGFMVGFPTSASLEGGERVAQPQTMILEVVSNSPAEEAGLKSGDSILSLSQGEMSLDAVNAPIEDIRAFINSAGTQTLNVTIERGETTQDVLLIPREDVVPGRFAIGVSMDKIGILKLPWWSAIIEGAKSTFSLSAAVVIGLFQFFTDAFSGGADLSQVTGPVGIVSLVGDASTLGFVYLLGFTAFISVHLAVINLVPFPALDGGRLLFVLIEALKGSPIKARIANTLNTIGFILLIMLMLFITYQDILRLF